MGQRGPIISTIHGSKGREATSVILNLWEQTSAPDTDKEAVKDAEEARVLYVGLSRAREQLRVFPGSARTWKTLKSGRAWHSIRHNALQTELGREGDLDSLASIRYLRDSADSWQERLASFDGTIQEVMMRAQKQWWRIILPKRGDEELAVLSRAARQELESIADQVVRGQRLSWLSHLRWLDVTSVAVRPDSHDIDELPMPYRETRVWLMPVLSGMGYWMCQNRGKS
ncbi:MAG: 3'-5' exonuclease [Myxococcota bacterium]